MISVDTSVLVRYLVGTPRTQARSATQLVDGEDVVGVPVVVLLETAHVLRTQYGVDRADVLDTLLELITRENIEVLGLHTGAVIEALGRARRIPGSPLPDALVAATVRTLGAQPLYSFEAGIARHGVAVETP